MFESFRGHQFREFILAVRLATSDIVARHLVVLSPQGQTQQFRHRWPAHWANTEQRAGGAGSHECCSGMRLDDHRLGSSGELPGEGIHVPTRPSGVRGCPA